MNLRESNFITGPGGTHGPCSPQGPEQGWLEGRVGKTLDLESGDPDLPVSFSVTY